MILAGSWGENLEREKSFSIGINYWPGETAMYWWERFDSSIARRDFSRLAEFRFDLRLKVTSW